MPVASALKTRPRHELVMSIFGPPAAALVRFLAPLGVNPLLVVLAHCLVGLVAAALLAFAPGKLWLAALLLQLKTVLDNADGGLARATGRVTLMGRYLDTVCDLLVNFLLFAALARYGPTLPALGAFVVLTFILSMDFNLEHLYRAQRRAPGPPDPLPIGAPMALYRLAQGVYGLLLEPQDRLIRKLDQAAFERAAGLPAGAAPLELRLAWNDMFSTASMVNLGLSSQLLVLGACLALGQPYWYVALVYLQAVYVCGVTLMRGPRLKGYLRRLGRDA